MGGWSWRRRGAVGLPAALVLTATLGTPSRAEDASPHEPVLQIERVLEIDTVLELRRVDALVAEVAAAEQAAAAAQAAPVSFVKAGQSGIPVTVLAAYHKAEANLAASMPACHLPWWVLAGIGRIESGHAGGGRVDDSGTTRGSILGPRLDGSLAGAAVIRDSDGGALDGDPAFDRAVGPMQFLPGTWKAYARDGNGDGVANPHNVFDAATTAGVYLCRNGGDLSVPANLARAILAYNHSDSYLQSVLSWGMAYRDGVTPAADGAGAIPATPVRQPETAAPAAAASPASTPAPAPTPGAPSTPPPSTLPPTTPPTTTTTPPTTTTTPPTTTTTPPTTTTTPPPPTTPPTTTTPPPTGEPTPTEPASGTSSPTASETTSAAQSATSSQTSTSLGSPTKSSKSP